MARLGGLPLSVLILIAVAAITSLVASATILGRWLYSVGINARLRGQLSVPVERDFNQLICSREAWLESQRWC
jgi:ribose/xylose/arabinose/galactoside ABC-type transport system permease subunit